VNRGLSHLIRLFIPLVIVLLLVPVTAQTTLPPQIDRAIALLSQALGRPLLLTDFDRYGFTQAFFPDTSLGCALRTTPTTFAVPVSVYTVELIYQEIRYEFRVREDLTDAFPCDAALLALTPGAPNFALTATPDAVSNCPLNFEGYLRPRLIAGGQASIGLDGAPNRLRARPVRDAEQIGLIAPGTTFDVLDGPSCEDLTKIIWWRVSADGVIGWTAEGVGADYFIDPIAGGPLNLPPERARIAPASANLLAPLTEIAFGGGTAVAFSDDGKIVIGGASGLLIYDLVTGSQLDLQLTIAVDVAQVAYSPDGRYIAFASQDDTLYITDTQTGTTITPSDAPDTDIRALAFSSGNLLAISGGDLLGDPSVAKLWAIYDIPNQRQLAVNPTTSAVRDVAFSPDGTLFAWIDSALNVINVTDGTPLLAQPIAVSGVRGLAWRPLAVAGAPNQVAYADGSQVRTITFGGTAAAFGDAPAFFPGVIRYSPDGLLIAAMNLQSAGEPVPAVVTLYDAATGELLYGTGYDLGTDLQFSPDGTLLVLVTADSVVFLGVDPEGIAVG